MFRMLKKFLGPPVFEGEAERTRLAGILNFMLWLGLVTSSGALILAQYLVVPGNRLSLSINFGSQVIIWIVLHITLRRGHVRTSAAAFITLIFVTMVSQLVQRADILSGVGVVNFFIIVSLSTLLLQEAGIISFTILSIASLFGVYFAASNGWIIPRLVQPTPFSAWVFYSAVYLVVSVILYTSSSSLRKAIHRAQTSENSLAAANRELQSLNQNLEGMVAERTQALDSANTHNARRANLFQAIAQVARAITSINELETLLPNIANLISERFNYYHVGIFLVDAAREYAVLSATNSEGGKRMLGRGHRLRIGQVGIVGYATGSGSPRIALDTGKDVTFFNNPDLPDTRSEIALPLQIGGEIIGALDVQSKDANAFEDEDIAILTTLADQVAIAIQNARLLRETQTALAESQALFGNYIQKAWTTTSKLTPITGYRFTGTIPSPLDGPINTPEMRTVLEEGRVVTTSGTKGQNSVTVPLKLRSETVGVLNVNAPAGREWDPDEVDIIESAAERIALALENATLLEASSRLAKREHQISDISAKISSGTEMETILRTAVEELGRQISGANIILELESNE